MKSANLSPTIGALCTFSLLSPLGLVVVSPMGYELNNVLGGEVTLCECVNEPIRTGEKALACGRLTESLGPQVVATETMKCRETLAPPAGGPDICFCMRSNSQDPEIQQACMALINTISPNEMGVVLRDCARKPYQEDR